MIKKLKVKDMTCNHCVKRITNSLNIIEGITDINISLNNKTVEVTYEGNLYSAIKNAINEAGYEIEE